MLKTYTKEWKLNFKLAYPVMIAQLGQMTVQFADMVMVGRLGADALAAANFGNAVFGYCFILAIGLSIGVTPLVAAANGEGNEHHIFSYFKHAFIFALVLGSLITVLLLLSIPLLHHFKQPKIVLDFGIPYLKVLIYSYIPFLLFGMIKGISDGVGLTKIAMKAIIIGNTVNILGNYIFIYGKWGAPALGVTGAGIGTLLARITACLLLFSYFVNVPRLREVLKQFYHEKFKFSVVKKMVGIGLPSAMYLLFEGGLFSTSAIIAGSFGSVSGAANTIMNQLCLLGFLMMTGFGVATTIRVGNQWGAKNIPYLRLVAHSNILVVILFMALYSVMIFSLRSYIPHIFVDDNAVVELASHLLLLVLFFYVTEGVQMVIAGALRGMQDTLIPMLCAFVSYWIIGFPAICFFAYKMELEVFGVWLGIAVGLFTLPIFLWLRLGNRLHLAFKNRQF